MWVSLLLSGSFFLLAANRTRGFLPRHDHQPQQHWLVSTTQHSTRSSVATTRHSLFGRRQRNDADDDDTRIEAFASLVDFHQGSWKGKARSFTVTADVAAGILQRKTFNDYTVHVELTRRQPTRDSARTDDFYLIENIQGPVEQQQQESYRNTPESPRTCRKLSLTDCHMDVDVVDASYSLDVTLPVFPSFLSGTQKVSQFLVEHCIATSDDHRVRCFALYGSTAAGAMEISPSSSNLIRVVVCEEERIKQNHKVSSSQLLPEALCLSSEQSEMDRDVNRLVDRAVGHMLDEGSNDKSLSSSSTSFDRRNVTEKHQLDDVRKFMLSSQQQKQQPHNDDETNGLKPHPVSLLELSSGVWLGDCIIRDLPMVLDSPLQLQQPRGFGTTAKRNNKSFSTETMNDDYTVRFARWSEGVQKVAWRLIWDFGEEIRQINDFGKSMGAELAPALTKGLSGSVCVNEGLSRRIPADERMVYIDWNEDNVGLLIGSHSVLLPRYLNFDSTRRIRPFYTEFCTYQKADGARFPDNIARSVNDEDKIVLPEVVCSKLSRLYNYQGRLKQGSSSFFTLKRFGTEK